MEKENDMPEKIWAGKSQYWFPYQSKKHSRHAPRTAFIREDIHLARVKELQAKVLANVRLANEARKEITKLRTRLEAAEGLRVALVKARKRIEYLGVVCGEKHERWNDQYSLQGIDTALTNYQPVTGGE